MLTHAAFRTLHARAAVPTPAVDKMSAAKPNKLYNRYVQIGRVVVVNYGPEAGKLATIIDVVDQNRVRAAAAAGAIGIGQWAGLRQACPWRIAADVIGCRCRRVVAVSLAR
jgi:hypothetical protein